MLTGQPPHTTMGHEKADNPETVKDILSRIGNEQDNAESIYMDLRSRLLTISQSNSQVGDTANIEHSMQALVKVVQIRKAALALQSGDLTNYLEDIVHPVLDVCHAFLGPRSLPLCNEVLLSLCLIDLLADIVGDKSIQQNDTLACETASMTTIVLAYYYMHPVLQGSAFDSLRRTQLAFNGLFLAKGDRPQLGILSLYNCLHRARTSHEMLSSLECVEDTGSYVHWTIQEFLTFRGLCQSLTESVVSKSGIITCVKVISEYFTAQFLSEIATICILNCGHLNKLDKLAQSPSLSINGDCKRIICTIADTTALFSSIIRAPDQEDVLTTLWGSTPDLFAPLNNIHYQVIFETLDRQELLTKVDSLRLLCLAYHALDHSLCSSTQGLRNHIEDISMLDPPLSALAVHCYTAHGLCTQLMLGRRGSFSLDLPPLNDIFTRPIPPFPLNDIAPGANPLLFQPGSTTDFQLSSLLCTIEPIVANAELHGPEYGSIPFVAQRLEMALGALLETISVCRVHSDRCSMVLAMERAAVDGTFRIITAIPQGLHCFLKLSAALSDFSVAFGGLCASILSEMLKRIKEDPQRYQLIVKWINSSPSCLAQLIGQANFVGWIQHCSIVLPT
uniref:ARAD1D37994p n=1 Tax=Blastobotrys adeninivorans TaxID=409370 RepID=A0A060TCA0_BLAAD